MKRLMMATVLLGAVKLGTVVFGVSASTVLLVTAVASVVYSSLGGIRGTIYTDFFLFATIMVGAFAVMYYGFARPEVGGFAALMQKPEVISKLNFLPDFKDTDTLVAVFVIPVAIQWWNVWYSGSEPGGGGYIVQRMLTAKTPNHALGGTLFAQIVQYVLRPWPWYLTAFASIVLFPDLDSIRAAFPNVDPRLVGNDMAYPAMIKFVPAGWLGVVAASMMGALFSTIAAQISMGANYVSNDVWKRFVRANASDRELVRVARITSVALMVLGCLLVPMLESAKSPAYGNLFMGNATGDQTLTAVEQLGTPEINDINNWYCEIFIDADNYMISRLGESPDYSLVFDHIGDWQGHEEMTIYNLTASIAYENGYIAPFHEGPDPIHDLTPEPTSGMLLLVGAALLALRRRAV